MPLVAKAVIEMQSKMKPHMIRLTSMTEILAGLEGTLKVTSQVLAISDSYEGTGRCKCLPPEKLYISASQCSPVQLLLQSQQVTLLVVIPFYPCPMRNQMMSC